MKPTIYLAGPIMNCTSAEVKDWRGAAHVDLRDIAKIIDPACRDFRGKETRHMKEIVERDIDWIGESNILLANCWKPSAGTSMEIFYAGRWSGIHVITVVKGKVSPWIRYFTSERLFGHGKALFMNIEAALRYTVKIIKEGWI